MIELRISPGGRRSLVHLPVVPDAVVRQAEASFIRLHRVGRDGRVMVPPPRGFEAVITQMMYADGDDIDTNLRRIQQEKNALYSKAISGDKEAADAIQLRIHAQIRLLEEKRMVQDRERNPISAALVPVYTA